MFASHVRRWCGERAALCLQLGTTDDSANEEGIREALEERRFVVLYDGEVGPALMKLSRDEGCFVSSHDGLIKGRRLLLSS